MQRSIFWAVFVASVLVAFPPLARSSTQPTELSESEMLTCARRLNELGYWIDLIDSKADESVVAAIRAFRRVTGYKNSGPPNTLDLLALKKARPLKLRANGLEHFEVDVKRQIIFFVSADGHISRILPASTGNGSVFNEGGKLRLAITPRGRFAVYQKISGWRIGPLGAMYFPNYIIGGVSVHGSEYVADYPRTHGCIAVPLFAAERLSEMMPVGTIIIIRRSIRVLS